MPTIKGIYVDGVVYNYEDANIAPNFQFYKRYLVNDLVLHDGILYRCILSHISNNYFDIKKWEPINLEEYLKNNFVSLLEETSADFYSSKRPNRYDFSHVNSDGYFTERLENDKVFRYNITKNENGYINKIIDTSTGFETSIVWSDNEGSSSPRKITATLSSDWEGNESPYYQNITIQGITNKSYITLCPTANQLNQLIDNGVQGFNIENNNGILTAYVIGDKPTDSIDIQCIIEETL